MSKCKYKFRKYIDTYTSSLACTLKVTTETKSVSLSQNKTKQMILLKFAQCVKQQPHTGNPLHRPGGNMNHWPFCKTWPSVPHSSTTERGSGKADCRGGLNEGLKKTQISFQMPGQHEGKRPDKCGDSGTETAKGYPRILSARVVAGVERWRDLERVKSRGLP